MLPVSVTYEQVAADFVRLRDFVLGDVERILTLEPGANYAAAAVIACGFEALADVRDGHRNAGQRPFAETLPAAWRPVAPSLFDALRNGIIHGYETQRIVVAGCTVELAIAWRDGEHLTWSAGQLVLNVRDLAEGLRERFEAYEERLNRDVQLRELFLRRRRRNRERAATGADAEAWRVLLASAKSVRP